MREFPNSLRLAPGGEFVIAKGNQQATTLGRHNGICAARLRRRPARHDAGLWVPSAVRRRQPAHRPRHGERSARQLHPLDAVAHRLRPAVLRLSQRVGTARSLSDADRRSAHVDSARRERIGHLAGVALRRQDGTAQRRARAHRLQQPRAVSRLSQHADDEASGRGREHHAGVRVSAAQRLDQSRRTASSMSPAFRSWAGGRPRRASPASAACATPARPPRFRSTSCRWTRACCCASA